MKWLDDKTETGGILPRPAKSIHSLYAHSFVRVTSDHSTIVKAKDWTNER